MTTRTYHHGDLRQALVEAGIELAREHGPQGVVVREAARRVGVSHNAAYRHFADRDSLVEAIAAEAMEQLTASMERRLAVVDRRAKRQRMGPVRRAELRVRATGNGYVDFAMDQPGMFRLMVGTTFPDLLLDPGSPYVPSPLDVLTRALDELDEVGGMAPGRRPSAETLCWSTVHGFAALHLDGPLRGASTKARNQELERVLDAIHFALTGR